MLKQGKVRVKELDKVRLCRIMRVSATRNNREGFPDSKGLTVDVGLFIEK